MQKGIDMSAYTALPSPWRLEAVSVTSERPSLGFQPRCSAIGASGEDHRMMGREVLYILYIKTLKREWKAQRTTAPPVYQVHINVAPNKRRRVPLVVSQVARRGASPHASRSHSHRNAGSRGRPRRGAHYITLPLPKVTRFRDDGALPERATPGRLVTRPPRCIMCGVCAGSLSV